MFEKEKMEGRVVVDPEGKNSNNITSLTAPLTLQYTAFNPMDNKLLHLLVTENQYLQFMKILSTSRNNANKLLEPPSLQFRLQMMANGHSNYDYQDLLKSFCSDTTLETNTEISTELEEDEAVIQNKVKDILINEDDMANLIQNLEFSSTDEDDGITEEDLERYEQLLNDFESTREEDVATSVDVTIPVELVETQDILQDLNDVDGEDDSFVTLNNSFTDYLRKKLRDDDVPQFLKNPQIFLKKVPKIWKLLPKNLEPSGNLNDINRDQFHEFFVKWKAQHKSVSTQEEQEDEVQPNEEVKLQHLIVRNPDIEVLESDVTEELIESKISTLYNTEASSPFEFFYNDQLRNILQDAKNFNLKKKEIKLQIISMWAKLSVLEKARYSSIVIDESKRETVQLSPNKRSVSYHGSVPGSKFSSPTKRSVSVSMVPTAREIPPLKFESKNRIPTPPISPDSLEGSVQSLPDVVENFVERLPVTLESPEKKLSDVVRSPERKEVEQKSPDPAETSFERQAKLHKKKSWGRDDNWL